MFVQLEGEVVAVRAVGFGPGMQLYLDESVWLSKKDLVSSMLRASWNVNIQDGPQTEGWFIMTNLPDLESTILSYKKKIGIEMFRDFKSGGYKLEGTNVTGERLVVMVLLIAILYTTAYNAGKKIKMGIQKYMVGWKRQGEMSDSTAAFILVYGQTWVRLVEQCAERSSVNDTWSQ